MSDMLCPFLGGKPCMGKNCEFDQGGDCLLSSLAFKLHEMVEDMWEAYNDGNPSVLAALPVTNVDLLDREFVCDVCKKRFKLGDSGATCFVGKSGCREFYCSEECHKAHAEEEAERKRKREASGPPPPAERTGRARE